MLRIGVMLKLKAMQHENVQKFCSYYQAHVIREQAWFFVAVVRSYEHMMFDRTFDPQTSIFEFFVPVDMEDRFLAVMAVLIDQGVVEGLCAYQNRLSDPKQVV